MEAVGQFHSLRGVLQVVGKEQQQLMELKQVKEGTKPCSHRDSFSNRYSPPRTCTVSGGGVKGLFKPKRPWKRW